MRRFAYLCAAVLVAGGFMLAWLSCGDDDGGGGDAVCGNNVLESGEECDDGNTASGDGCSATCQSEGTPECGNDILETGEECDDGNTVSGDGCSATCQNETGPECGNNVVEAGEQCDDGNTDDGDGCSSTCEWEGAGASVSGGAGRLAVTCTAAYGSVGTLCISLRTDCADAQTEVASAEVENADMTAPVDGPQGFQSPPVPFEVQGIEDGSYQLHAYLDKDGTGCWNAPTTDDLEMSAGCVAVTVTGGNDVTDVTVEFDTIH